jgi:hypothetical protein
MSDDMRLRLLDFWTAITAQPRHGHGLVVTPKRAARPIRAGCAGPCGGGGGLMLSYIIPPLLLGGTPVVSQQTAPTSAHTLALLRSPELVRTIVLKSLGSDAVYVLKT